MNFEILIKTCSKCNIEKPLSEFSKTKRNKDGFQSHCKQCVKKYRASRRDEINAYNKKYREDNSEKFKIIERKRRHRKRDPEKIKIKNKKYREKNVEKIKYKRKIYSQTPHGKAEKSRRRHEYRARMRGVTIEKFSPLSILNRDKYICQSCGCKTRPDFKNTAHPKYPNVDHIIPLSCGGEHSMRNCQCLCHRCNMVKHNNQKNDQLLLFGC